MITPLDLLKQIVAWAERYFAYGDPPVWVTDARRVIQHATEYTEHTRDLAVLQALQHLSSLVATNQGQLDMIRSVQSSLRLTLPVEQTAEPLDNDRICEMLD